MAMFIVMRIPAITSFDTVAASAFISDLLKY